MDFIKTIHFLSSIKVSFAELPERYPPPAMQHITFDHVLNTSRVLCKYFCLHAIRRSFSHGFILSCGVIIIIVSKTDVFTESYPT